MVSEYLRQQWREAAIAQMECESFYPTKQVVTWVERHLITQFLDFNDEAMLSNHNYSKVSDVVHKIKGDKSRKVGGYFLAVLPTLKDYLTLTA